MISKLPTFRVQLIKPLHKSNTTTMDLTEAQKDMRLAYMGGADGAIVSGLLWISSGLLSPYLSQQSVILFFFFGGMLIHPLGILISKICKRTAKHKKENPLGKLALESTVILFVGLFISYSIFQIKPDWFFPIMLLTIGVRYLIFQTLYGMKIYWLFGLALMASGMYCLYTNQTFHIPAIIGGLIELVFAFLIMRQEGNFPR